MDLLSGIDKADIDSHSDNKWMVGMKKQQLGFCVAEFRNLSHRVETVPRVLWEVISYSDIVSSAASLSSLKHLRSCLIVALEVISSDLILCERDRLNWSWTLIVLQWLLLIDMIFSSLYTASLTDEWQWHNCRSKEMKMMTRWQGDVESLTIIALIVDVHRSCIQFWLMNP